jgi:hypothetical protein
MSRRHFLDDSIAQVQTKEKGNFRKSHKFHQLDYRFSVKKARRRICDGGLAFSVTSLRRG